jgi:hypothetical protein
MMFIGYEVRLEQMNYLRDEDLRLGCNPAAVVLVALVVIDLKLEACEHMIVPSDDISYSRISINCK